MRNVLGKIMCVSASTVYRALTILAVLLGCIMVLNAQETTDVYFIPGQGADYRLFEGIQLETGFNMIHVNYSVPERRMSMSEFALELSAQIDTTRKFVLVGTSLGGMLAVEMAEFLTPEKIVLISSAKGREELPLRYRFQKYVPVFELVPGRLIKKGALFLQPLVEPDSRNNRDTFRSMLSSKDPKFLKRTIRMIFNWDRKVGGTEIIHIHGDSDKTIPVRNVDCDHVIKNGSHMLTLTRASVINEILKMEL